MTDEQISLEEWAPSDTQREVAEYLAAGYSQNRTAQICKVVDLRTIQRWWAEHDEDGRYPYREFVNRWKQEILANANPKFASLVDKCQEIQLRVADGNLDPNSGLAIWAERQLSRTLYPVMVATGLARSGIPINPQQALRLVGGDAGQQPTIPYNPKEPAA